MTLIQLLFSLPVSNGKLERVFSTLKNIKVDKRSSLGNETLDDLLTINTDKVNVNDFDPDHSIELWWKAKTRRLNQNPRKQYQKKNSASTSGASASVEDETDSDIESTQSSADCSEDFCALDDWDKWFDNEN